MQMRWLFSMFRTRKGMLKGNAFFDLITWAMTFINSQTRLWIALSVFLFTLCLLCFRKTSTSKVLVCYSANNPLQCIVLSISAVVSHFQNTDHSDGKISFLSVQVQSSSWWDMKKWSDRHSDIWRLQVLLSSQLKRRRDNPERDKRQSQVSRRSFPTVTGVPVSWRLLIGPGRSRDPNTGLWFADAGASCCHLYRASGNRLWLNIVTCIPYSNDQMTSITLHFLHKSLS